MKPTTTTNGGVVSNNDGKKKGGLQQQQPWMGSSPMARRLEQDRVAVLLGHLEAMANAPAGRHCSGSHSNSIRTGSGRETLCEITGLSVLSVLFTVAEQQQQEHTNWPFLSKLWTFFL